jgi:hypothetical protein
VDFVTMLQGDSLPLTPEVVRGKVFPFAIDYAYVVSAAAVLSFGMWVFARREWRGILVNAFLPAVALGTAGLTIGILVGNSLTSIANVALSGFLTIYGGLVIYLFGKEAEQTWTRIAAAVGLTFIAAGMVYGASIGSAFRYRHEQLDSAWREAMEQRKKQFDARLGVWEYQTKKQIDVIADSRRRIGSIDSSSAK